MQGMICNLIVQVGGRGGG